MYLNKTMPRKEHKNIDNIEHKHCPICDDWKSLKEYNKQSSSWDNLARICRKCNIEYKRKKRETKQYQEKDKEYYTKYGKLGIRKEKDKVLYGFIYKIISPNNKSYIGQVREYLKNGDKKGIQGRWRQHINSSNSNSEKGCTYLNRAIKKYKHNNFTVVQLMKCKIELLDLFEEFYIKTHTTLVPNGYNLQTGGTNTTHSLVTCQKRSESLKKLLQDESKRKIWSDAKKGIIQKHKRKCKKQCNQSLPKYIYYRESHQGKYKGYVVEHPNGTKRFSKQKYSLEENLKSAKKYLEILSSKNVVK